MLVKTFLALLIAFPLLAFANESIRFSKSQSFVDEPITLETTGLIPGSKYTVGVSAKDALGRIWSSQATYLAKANGSIDFNEVPFAGSYSVGHSQGLFWSMRPSNYILDTDFFRPQGDFEIEVELLKNEVRIAKQTTKRLFSAGEMVTETSRTSRGTFDFVYPKGSEKIPLVVLLGGSEGGLNCKEAALIASSGYAVLCLAYFNTPSLPQELADIPLEYLQENILRAFEHPVVDEKRVYVWGTSKGAELALLLASRMPVIRGVVAVVPSGIVWQGLKQDHSVVPSWSFDGKPIAYLPFAYEKEDLMIFPFKSRIGYERALAKADDPSFAEIPVEKIAGPIFLVSGTDDQVWPSSQMADLIQKRLQKHSFPFAVTHLKYQDAGHFIGWPAWPTSGRIFAGMTAGGNSTGDGIAGAESRPRIMRFLKLLSGSEDSN